MMRHNNHLKNDKSLDDAFVAVIVHRVHSGTDPTVYSELSTIVDKLRVIHIFFVFNSRGDTT